MIEILIIFCVPLVLGDFPLLILHTNDMHARYDQVDPDLGRCEEGEFCYGGFARLHAMVNHFKGKAASDGRMTLFLNAGDTFQGTSYYSFYKWKLAAKMMNTLGIDAMTLGIHEFDDGIENLASYINEVNIPIVCSNLDLSEVPSLKQPNLTSSKVLLVDGTSVGIVGYLYPFNRDSELSGLKILDEITSIREEVSKLKNEGVKIIIALGHSGIEKDLEIAKNVEDIDLVIGGRSHTFLYSGKKIPEIEEPEGPYPTIVTQASGKQVPVVQAYYGTKYLGYLELDFDNEGNLKSYDGTPILLLGVFPQTQYVLQELEPYKTEVDQKIDKVFGYVHMLVDKLPHETCKMSECELGNLITDAFTDYMAEHCSEHKVTVGLMNTGGIVRSLDLVQDGKNSSITGGDIMSVIPSGRPIVVLNLPGEVLLEALEFAVSKFTDDGVTSVDNFLQVSGLRITYNLSKQVGKRVSHVKVLCSTCSGVLYRPLKLGRKYAVAVPEYLAQGGDDFFMFKNITRECVSEEVDYSIVAQYIEKYNPVNPEIERRIQIVYGDLKEIILTSLSCFMILLLVVSIIRHYFNSKKK